MHGKKKRDSVTSVLYPLLFGVFILILWQTQALHKLFHTDTYILPLPSRILRIIADNTDSIRENVIASLTVILAGLNIFSYSFI